MLEKQEQHQKQAIIKQSNRLIEARYKLTLNEQKMIIAICSQLDKNAENFSLVRMKVADMASFCEFTGKDRYTVVKNVIMKLLDRKLMIHYDNGGWYGTHWLQSARYIPEESMIEYRIDDTLKPELLKLKSAYLSTALSPLMTMNRDYSIRLYMFVKKMLKIHTFSYELNEIREMFCLGKTYEKISNLKNKVIEPAITEINEKSDINIKHEYINEGRSFTKIRFTVTLKKPISEEEKIEEETGQLRLGGVMSDSVQELADKLIKRGVSASYAKQLAKKYDSERIIRNLNLALKQKNNNNTNFAGLIVHFIKEDIAGQNEQAKKELAEREKVKQADKKQAKEFFNNDNEIKGDYENPVIIKDGKIISQ